MLAKDDNSKDRLENVIYNLLEAIRVSAVYLYPFMPNTSDEIFRQLNITDKSDCYNSKNIYSTIKPEPLFKRIDVKKV